MYARSLYTAVQNLESLSAIRARPRKVSRLANKDLCEAVTIYICMQSTSLFSAGRRARGFYQLQTDVLAKTTSMELMFVLNLAGQVHVSLKRPLFVKVQSLGVLYFETTAPFIP